MFKNITFFQLGNLNVEADTLSDLLADNPFQPCPAQSLESQGWLEPGGEGEGFVMESGGAYLLRLGIDKKSIPGKIVKKHMDERIHEFTQRIGSEPTKTEKQEMKEKIIFELTPKVIAVRSDIDVIISPKEGWMAIDTASESAASKVLANLQAACDGKLGLSLKIVVPGNDAGETMTAWLKSGSAPKGWDLTGDAVLKDKEGKITCKNQDLFSDEVLAHVNGGMHVENATLKHAESLTFTLTNKLAVKSIKPVAELKIKNTEMVDEMDQPSEALLMKSQLLLFKPVYRGLYDTLNKVFNVQKAA